VVSISSVQTSNLLEALAAASAGDIATDYIPTTTTAVSVGMTANVPRLDYSQGSCPALLLEPQRTNLVTYSEQFDNGAWSKTDITVTQNDAISPDGYQNADLITTGVSNSDQISRTITLAATNTITQSVFIKRVGGADWVDFIAVRNGFANAVKVWFNISTLTVGGNYAGGTTSLNSASIENYGNGWLRLIVTTTDSTNNTNFDTRLRTASADLSDTRVNNSSYYLWGIQLEAGSYATSYIPTTSATVTRLADSCSKTGISSLIGQTEGTLYWEGRTISGVGTDLLIVGNITNSVFINITSSNQVRIGIRANNALLLSPSGGTIAANNKIALAYKSGDIVAYLNGIEVITNSTSFTFSDLISSIEIGRPFYDAKATQFNQASALFTTRLTNTQLAELTTL
jgi:hypothetical protein